MCRVCSLPERGLRQLQGQVCRFRLPGLKELQQGALHLPRRRLAAPLPVGAGGYPPQCPLCRLPHRGISGGADRGQGREAEAGDRSVQPGVEENGAPPELDKILNKLYEDSALGRIGEGRRQSMAAQYEQEQHDLRAKKTGLETLIQHAEKVYANAENYMLLIRYYYVV